MIDIQLTYAEILPIYQLNSGNFLRHGSLYYTWGQHSVKISSKSNEGVLKKFKISNFLLNKTSSF